VTEPDHDGRIGALDGIRGVAVAAVLLFHAGVSSVSGGMLGVDVFFALSGFLITSLIVTEYSRSGSVGLGRFYARRARRLVPALIILLLGVAAFSRWMADPSTMAAIRGDALSTLLYSANWRFVFSHQSYFAHYGPPSPLLHTWSLAVEEQFYLLWPLVCLVALQRWGRRGVGIVAGMGALVSVAVSVGLYSAGASSARLYYGTDTRAQAVLAGACLGAFWPALASPRLASSGRKALVGLAGLIGAAYVLWAFHAVAGNSPSLYHGGFLFVALATLAVILVVTTQPRALITRALSVGPLRYVGRISYGVYLFHYPLFLVLTPQTTGQSGSTLLVLRLAVTLVAASLSFHLLEEPIRTRRLFRGWGARLAVPVFAGVAAGALVAATISPVSAAEPGGLRSAARVEMATPTGAQQPKVRAAAGPTSDETVHTVLVGDSMALTLGKGLSRQSAAWGVSVADGGVLGCDLDPQSTVNVQGVVGPAAQGCLDWQARWASVIKTYDPDVVAVEIGRWEVEDRIVAGHWSTIGKPGWDNLLADLLGQAIMVLGQHGAKVVFFTLPYITQTSTMPNGQPWDINRPARTDDFNALLRWVVARYPEQAAIIDINKLLSPAGHYASYIDGIRVRSTDEEHISVAGGMFLRPAVLPQLAAFGQAHAAVRPPGTPWFPPAVTQ
jgi:peptidoglycan/LPS O-acetylase OafA/YrhL